MNSRKLSILTAIGLVLLGLLCMSLRYQSRRQAQIAREESYWRLMYEVQFDALPSTEDVEALLRLPVPFDTRFFDVAEPNAHHPGLRSRDRGPLRYHGTRELELSAQRPGPYYVSATFLIRQRPPSDLGPEVPFEYLTPEARARFLQSSVIIPTDDPEVGKIAQQAVEEGGGTAAESVMPIFRYCQSLPAGDTDDVADVVGVKKNASPKGRARTMVALCRANRIPARLVTGFEIKESRGRLAEVQQGAPEGGAPSEGEAASSNNQEVSGAAGQGPAAATPRADASSPRPPGAIPHVWMEAYLGQRWVPFDPTNGYSYSTNLLPVRKGGDEVITRENVRDQTFLATYSITRIDPVGSPSGAGEKRPSQILDLTRLPVPMHEVIKLLLLLPFAALITSLMRNVVGMLTYGTFGPALLAMSFIYADWQTGLAILIVVVTIGLIGRTLLERLRLLMVPRLSIVLTTAILCVVFGVSLLYYVLPPSVKAQAVLLPMVILTMLIERFHVSMEEDGLIYTLKMAVGTLVVAVLCYLMLRWDKVGNTLLIYPEAHFITMAAFVMLGRYAGYRLTELWRFRDLIQERETKQ